MTHTKEEYRKLKEMGLCIECRKEKAAEGHVYCEGCLKWRNHCRVLFRIGKKATGCCGWVGCEKPICEASKWLCEKHAEEKRRQNAVYRARRAKECKIS